MVARRFPMNFTGEGCEFDPRRRYIFPHKTGPVMDSIDGLDCLHGSRFYTDVIFE